MKNQKLVMGFLLLVIVFSLTSCAANGYAPYTSGFFAGIWHGIVLPFALIGKLFGADIGIYAENNTGFFYWLGFISGIGGLGGGGYATGRYVIM